MPRGGYVRHMSTTGGAAWRTRDALKRYIKRRRLLRVLLSAQWRPCNAQAQLLSPAPTHSPPFHSPLLPLQFLSALPIRLATTSSCHCRLSVGHVSCGNTYYAASRCINFNAGDYDIQGVTKMVSTLLDITEIVGWRNNHTATIFSSQKPDTRK